MSMGLQQVKGAPRNDPEAPDPIEADEYDRIYREGGLRAMAAPHIHYHQPYCPHAGCGHKMEWIDFNLETYGDRAGIYDPLVRAYWSGIGLAGRCPNCGGWIRFTTRRMEAIDENQAAQLPRLPDGWHIRAQFA